MNQSLSYPDYELSTDRATRYGRAAEVFHVLAHSDRLQIIELLQGGDISVGALEDQTELSQPVISRHLSILRRAHLVTSRRQASSVFYSLVDETGLLAILQSAL